MELGEVTERRGADGRELSSEKGSSFLGRWAGCRGEAKAGEAQPPRPTRRVCSGANTRRNGVQGLQRGEAHGDINTGWGLAPWR